MNWLEGVAAWLGLEHLADRFDQIDRGDGSLELLLLLLAATAVGAGAVALNDRARTWLRRLTAGVRGMWSAPR